jgi:mono/diheme cytochrome c family protein
VIAPSRIAATASRCQTGALQGVWDVTSRVFGGFPYVEQQGISLAECAPVGDGHVAVEDVLGRHAGEVHRILRNGIVHETRAVSQAPEPSLENREVVMMNFRRLDRSLLLLTVILGVVLVAPRRADAQVPQVKEVPARAIGSVDGSDSFSAYCAVCHGRDAKGNGPAAPALKSPIPDLTTIARRNGGKFDALAIERVISGSDKARPAHGSLEMPIWGQVFRTTQGDAAASIRLINLVKYLETIQQK